MSVESGHVYETVDPSQIPANTVWVVDQNEGDHRRYWWSSVTRYSWETTSVISNGTSFHKLRVFLDDGHSGFVCAEGDFAKGAPTTPGRASEWGDVYAHEADGQLQAILHRARAGETPSEQPRQVFVDPRKAGCLTLVVTGVFFSASCLALFAIA